MERWNWFMSYNAGGKWIVTDGYAEVTRVDHAQGPRSTYHAHLRYSPELPAYAKVEIERDGKDLIAEVTSNDPDTKAYRLQGLIAEWDGGQMGHMKSIILTDGQTILGIAHGDSSDERNMA